VHTVPDDDLVTCARVATDDVLGVLLTPGGVLVEILDVRRNGRHIVRTPCGNRAVVDGGRRIRTTQILLDPGHGGYEVGAVGPNGLREKSLNLDVALATAEELRERGFDVVLTRTTDLTLPIEIRANLANALRPDLFLSIHHNGGATARTPVPGTQAYYQHDDPESRRAAGILYEELFAAASRFPTAWVGNSKDGVSTRLNAEGTDFYGIHRRTPVVSSVITEFLWLSNGPEARLLERDEVRRAQAVALADGVERWYRSANRGSGYLGPFVDTFDSGGGGFEGCVRPNTLITRDRSANGARPGQRPRRARHLQCTVRCARLDGRRCGRHRTDRRPAPPHPRSPDRGTRGRRRPEGPAVVRVQA
jgi:N-acetylmuramoyl-L-alanine amidase